MDDGPRAVDDPRSVGRRGSRATAAALAALIAVVLSACTVRVDSGGAERSPAPTSSSTSGVVTVPLQIVHQQSATLAIVP